MDVSIRKVVLWEARTLSRGSLRQSNCLNGRFLSTKRPSKGFIATFIENIRQGMQKNKEIQESFHKLEKSFESLEKSSSLKTVRGTLDSARGKVGEAASGSSSVVKSGYARLRSTVAGLFENFQRTGAAKDAQEASSKILKEAKDTVEKVTKQGQELGKTQSFQNLKKGLGELKVELFDEAAAKSDPYKAPDKLRKRSAGVMPEKTEKVIQPNETVKDVSLTKESSWAYQWKAFKDDNPVLNRLFDLKMKYDESDNFLIRLSRAVTDRIVDTVGGILSPSETASAIAEIAKMDPSFDKEKFITQLQKDILPTVLEAYLAHDLDVLKDWCHEGAFAVISQFYEQEKGLGRNTEWKILDMRGVDILLGKVMDYGPVLVVSFRVQQLKVVRDALGKIIEGGDEHIETVHYIWAVCRDQSVFDPSAAWRVLEFGAQSASTQWV